MIPLSVHITVQLILDQLTDDEAIGCAQVQALGQAQEGRPWYPKIAGLYTIPTNEGNVMHGDTRIAFEQALNLRLDEIEKKSRRPKETWEENQARLMAQWLRDHPLKRGGPK